ncbi:MAG: hypothetical protein CVU90_02010 [Firmicutes bacterium HGW-Firmicutes-15]|nr:MAG: hypothetical protein CVU90_02010 [Firmicutes bacterium HGW-Firmicutes-15]
MRIPSFLLNQTAEINLHKGSSAYGDVYASNPNYTKAYLESSSRMIKSPSGDDTVATAIALVPYGTQITLNSHFTVDNHTYTVIGIIPNKGFTGSHLEVVLQ